MNVHSRGGAMSHYARQLVHCRVTGRACSLTNVKNIINYALIHDVAGFIIIGVCRECRRIRMIYVVSKQIEASFNHLMLQ